MKTKAVVYPVLVLLVGLVLYLFYPQQKDIDAFQSESVSIGFDYLPTSTTGQIIIHKYYTLSYNETYEQAEWVAYELTKEQLSNTNRKRPLFELDNKVKTRSAHWGNFKNSGYNKGHLLPAGDRKFSKEAYLETFLTSNISPQRYDFNAGIWNRLEQKVRYWAGKERHLYVVTGGILHDELKTIGREKVAIPEFFYKILLDYSEPEIKVVAFLIPHEDSQKPLYEFVTTIDKIESLTSIDFFSALPDDLENRLEASSDYKNWSF